MANIPKIYVDVVNDVIAECTQWFLEENVSESIVTELKELWLVKLEAKGEEFIDWNYTNTIETPTSTKKGRKPKLKSPNSDVSLKVTNAKKIQKGRSMPSLESEQQDSLSSSFTEKQIRIKRRGRPRKEQQLVSDVDSKIIKLGEDQDVKQPQIPLVPNKKRRGPAKSQLKLKQDKTLVSSSQKKITNTLKNTKTGLSAVCTSKKKPTGKQLLKSTKQNKAVLKVKCSSNIISKNLKHSTVVNNSSLSTNYQSSETENERKKSHMMNQNHFTEKPKAKLSYRVVLNRNSEMGLLKYDTKPRKINQYNYIFRNYYSNKNRLNHIYMKVILPHRAGCSIEERTCIVRVPCWSLEGTRLPKLLSPLIGRITNLTLPDATAVLQEYIDNYDGVLQVDGAGIKVRLKSYNSNNVTYKKPIKDSSDLDSDDDPTDTEETNTAFESKNRILCLFSVIKRRKNEWELTLRDGIIQVDNKVFMFKYAFGSVQW